MSHCHYYVSSTLYIIEERKSSSEMIRLLSLFLKLSTLSSPDLWFVKAQSLWGAQRHEYLLLCHLCKVRTPSQRKKNRFFSKCILDFICRLHIFLLFFFLHFIPFPVTPRHIPLLCVPHQWICIEIIPGWGMFTGHSEVTWVGRHYYSDTNWQWETNFHIFCFSLIDILGPFVSFMWCLLYVILF